MALASRRPSDRRIRRSLSRLETPPLRCLDERVVIARIRGHRGWGRGDVDLYDVHAAVGSVLRRRDCEIRMQVAHATIPSATPVARDERLPPRGRVEGAIRRERVGPRLGCAGIDSSGRIALSPGRVFLTRRPGVSRVVRTGRMKTCARRLTNQSCASGNRDRRRPGTGDREDARGVPSSRPDKRGATPWLTLTSA